METYTLIPTFAGLIAGGITSWLIEHKPQLLSGSVNKASDPNDLNAWVRMFTFMLALGAIYWVLGSSGFSIGDLFRFGILIAIISGAALFDLNHRLIPNRLILIGILGWTIIVLLGHLPVVESVITGASASFLILLIRWLGFLLFQKAGMGMGDVKLVFLIGLFMQWDVFWVLYLAIFVGGMYAGIGLGLRLLKRKHRLAFAPFLAIGVLLAGLLLPFNKFLDFWI